MSITKLFFAGSGGQGILLMGEMIAYASMTENKEVTFLPAYGPEMRGGTANCTVIVSDNKISCPLIFEADAVIAMNLPSMLRFESMVKPGGKLFINTSLINQKPTRTDIDIVNVPANELADELGNMRAANVVMLGAVLSATNVVLKETIELALKKTFANKKPGVFELNKKALYYFK